MNQDSEASAILSDAIQRFGRAHIAKELTINVRTLDRWQQGQISNPGMVVHALNSLLTGDAISQASESADTFDFIDLFAGIGGTRLGFERTGGRCVFTSEYDKFANKTYRENFGIDHVIAGDIRDVSPDSIPDHDVLVAGFPCQPFSIAGVSKKNSLGRAHGFDCDTQGTLFFCIEQILATKRPAAFLLENVKNLKSHDKGRTFETIRRTLQEKLGYKLQTRIIDGGKFTPQHRERIYLVGFREETEFNWDNISFDDESLVVGRTMGDILHPQNGTEEPEGEFTMGPRAVVNKKYTLSAKLWKYLRDYAQKHREKGNGFGYGLVGSDDTCRTLSARYYKDGSEILVSRGGRKNPRRLTPRECARLMGFPDSYAIPVSDTQAYKQFGNSVVVPVVQAIAKEMAVHVVNAESDMRKDGRHSKAG